MKTNILVTGLFLLAGLVSSCQSEIEESKGYGYLQLSSVDVNKTVTSRADVTSSEAIAVDVLDESDAVVKHADDWKDLMMCYCRLPHIPSRLILQIKIKRHRDLRHFLIMRDRLKWQLKPIKQKR